MTDNVLELNAAFEQGVLRNVAEDMKTPFLRILSQAQLGKITREVDLDTIETTAEAALRMLDSFIISTQVYNGQQPLELQPVSVTAVMYDTAQYLSKLAQLQGCELEVRSGRNVSLAMANSLALQAALTGLGYSFLHALGKKTSKKQVIIFSSRLTDKGVTAGIYSPQLELHADVLHRARKLKGDARQLMPSVMHGSSAGILVADTLLEAMDAKLKTSKYRSAGGLAATLLPSHQLSLL